MIQRFVEKCKIKKKITCHSFRRSFATNHHRNGTSSFKLKELMRHDTIKSTERYVQVTEKELIDCGNPLEFLKNKKPV